jgi:hypothetical protein
MVSTKVLESEPAGTIEVGTAARLQAYVDWLRMALLGLALGRSRPWPTRSTRRPRAVGLPD